MFLLLLMNALLGSITCLVPISPNSDSKSEGESESSTTMTESNPLWSVFSMLVRSAFSLAERLWVGTTTVNSFSMVSGSSSRSWKDQGHRDELRRDPGYCVE